jgi:hypothetical protein
MTLSMCNAGLSRLEHGFESRRERHLLKDLRGSAEAELEFSLDLA